MASKSVLQSALKKSFFVVSRNFSAEGAAKPVVTVFGGSGFVGRALTQQLLSQGSEVRIVTRDAQKLLNSSHANVFSQNGVTVHSADPMNPQNVEAAISGSSSVVNLIGILYETSSTSFYNAHVQASSNIAFASRRQGIKRLAHMSALGADLDSPSEYASTKFKGENVTQTTLPSATVFRPSIVFGPEDNFFNQFAEMARASPALPLLNNGETKFQPIYVNDVAQAFAKVAAGSDEEAAALAGKTFELGGPEVLNFRQLLEKMMSYTKQERKLVPIPLWAMHIPALFLQFLPEPPVTPDQLQLLKKDNVVSQGAQTLADLGITATPLDSVLPTYLSASS